MREWLGVRLLRLALWLLEPYWVPYEEFVSTIVHEMKTEHGLCCMCADELRDKWHQREDEDE